MTTLVEFIIVSGAENRPPMLDKAMYNSWESHMLLYIKGKKNCRMMLESIKNGPLVYPTVEEDGQIQKKKYYKLTEQEQLQDDCDVQATNIVLHGLPPNVYAIVNHCQFAKDIWERVKLLMKGTELSYQERECKLYNEFDKFTSVKGETLHEYYLRFAQLINYMHIIGMTMQQVQLYADRSQHEGHANKVRMMRERYTNPLALVANYQIHHLTPSVPHNAYHSLIISPQPQAEFPQLDSGLAVLVFLPGDDPIASGKARVVKCYNCKGEGHMARQCTQPKRLRNVAWFKEKMLLAQTQEYGQVLEEEQLAFLADLGFIDCYDIQPTIIHNAAFQTDDLDAHDFDCDDISSAKLVLMANLSSYGSDVLSEVPQHDTYQHDNMHNQSVQETPYFEQPLIDYVLDNEITSDSNIISYEQYLQQTQNVIVQDTNSSAQQLIEINEVKMVFNQMEAVVEQCSVDKKYFDIQTKEIYLDNDRLLEHIICQDVMIIVKHVDSVSINVLPTNNKCRVHDNLEIECLEQENDHLFELLLSQDIVHICVNYLATLTNYAKMEQDYIDEYNENLALRAYLAKKEHMIEKNFFNEVVLRCSRLKNRCVNLELKLQHQKESFLNNKSLNNQDAPKIQEFFNINEWQTKLNAKDVSTANLRKQ
ncbi:retrovirus-related pol polyprotein from transposon TNT 1-94 [Tanacetum coccineum]